MRIVNQKDFATGAFFLVFGALTALGATRYPMGTSSAMGPGYFPLLAGLTLAVIGVIVLIGSLARAAEPARFGSWSLPRVLVILAAVLLFAATLEPLGLIVALPLLVGVSSLAHREFSWRMTLLVTAILLPLIWLIFKLFLGLAIPLTPDF